jgi:hypothetical protein
LSILQLVTAPPNPILDNMTDQSNEGNRNYKYPNFDETNEPYWKAWPLSAKLRLRKHDDMEMAMSSIRNLAFKLREAWTPTDQPFVNNE